MFRIIARLLPLLLLVCIYPGNAGAQQSHPPALNLGDAVVTGFSGALPPANGKSTIDRTFINPDGPSARVVALGHPGFVWDGRLFAAPMPFDVPAKDVGQVFGIALDDASPPNIYLAATSVFGLNIVRRGHDGQPERRKKGGPGVIWMKGQFGLELQGGPGSIYKVDGRTGAVTLLADVTLNGVPNPAPSLGNLAYDSAHKQLFVSDLYTGMIHRFALDGRELDRFDHGVTALTAAKLASHAFNPRSRPNIASERFNSEDPDTWGYAPAVRRVWALAVHDGRLFYSARNGSSDTGPQIWSVGIAQDGGFASDPRWELDVPAKPGPYPVSDIAFTQGGAMVLAQRAPSTGAYNYVALTPAGEPRVLRYRLKDPKDPPSPGRWKPAPEEYAIGLAANYRNANGGVALGYGYGPDGVLRTDTCEAALWSTGQDLRNNPAMRRQLESGGPLTVNGLQGSPADMVRNANTPPMLSYFVDYDGKFDASARGHLGSVPILTKPCSGSAMARPVAVSPVTPVGGGNLCSPTCVCPEGTELKGKECVKIRCPQGTVSRNGKCEPNIKIKSDLACTPPMIQIIGGPCVCPPDMAMVDGKCVPVRCQPPQIVGPNGTCICPNGRTLQDGKCVPQICPAPLVPGPCCPPGTVLDGRECVKKVDNLGKAIFTKKVVYDGPILLPSQTYPVTVTCGSNTTTLNLPPNVPQTIGNLPYGTVCTYNEPTPPVPPNVCPPRSVGLWTTVFTPPPSLTINAPTTSVLVTNTLTCTPIRNPVDVGIVKTGGTTPACQAGYYDFMIAVTNVGSGWPATGNIVVTETIPAGMSFVPLAPGVWSCLPNGGSGGTVMMCTYTGPAPTSGQALPIMTFSATPTTSAPFPPYTNCASVAINSSSGYVDSNAANNNSCVTVSKPASCSKVCPPPQVMNVDNICVCPQGTTMVGGQCVPVSRPLICPPPQIMVPGVGCRCPDGEVLVNGKCVPPIVCKPPLVPNTDNSECVCPDHEVLRRGKCVKVEVPKHHKICKRGYVLKDGECVRRKIEQDEEHRESPNIRIPGSGGGFPRGGGGQGGGSGKR